MSFAFPWSSNRTTPTGLRLAALFFILALVGMSVVNAATISGPQNISNDGAESILPRIAQDPNGNVHAIWDSKEDGARVVRYAKGTWNGSSYNFGGSSLIANVGSFQYATPAIAVAPSGTVMAVWSDGTLRFKTWNSSASQPSGTTISLTGGIQPSVFPDAGSNFHIAWNGDFRLQYCQWNGSACSNRAAFDDTENAINRPDVAVDSNNNVHIVWDTGQVTKYRTRAANAVSFGPAQDIGGGNFPQIAADGKGNVYIVRSGDYNVIYCSKTINTACGSQHVIDAAQDLQPSVAATRSGSVVVTFRDTTNAVWYDSRENGAWQSTRLAGSGIQIDLSARPYTGRVSVVWSRDYEIQHATVMPAANICDVETRSLQAESVSALAGPFKQYLPTISSAPTIPICP